MNSKIRLFFAVAVAGALGACATVRPPLPPPPVPVTLHRPAAPLYHAAVGAQSCAAGSQNIAPVATLTFTPPTTNLDGTPVNGPLTYTLYEGASSGAETKAATGITASPYLVNSGIKGGTTVYFELTAVDANGNESPRSNEACKTFPVAPPNSFVITIQ